MTSTPALNMPPAHSNRGSKARRWQSLVALILAAAFLAGCSSGPGSREEFVDVLMRDGNLTENEATCISDGVFDEYEADEDTLKKISEAASIEDLEGEEGVSGFTEFYEATVQGCAQAGPAPG